MVGCWRLAAIVLGVVMALMHVAAFALGMGSGSGKLTANTIMLAALVNCGLIVAAAAVIAGWSWAFRSAAGLEVAKSATFFVASMTLLDVALGVIGFMAIMLV